MLNVIGEYPNELRADFQQFYGLDLDDMGHKFTFSHAAVLVTMLPQESRVVRAKMPEAEWGQSEVILARIEYWLHCLVYANSKDAKYKRNEPEPMKPPTKHKEHEKTDVEALKSFLAKPRKEVDDGN